MAGTDETTGETRMKLTPIRDYKWTDDYSFHRKLTCKNHPTARYLTKNPYFRSIHLIKLPDGETKECTCPFDDLMVIEED
jgi:hypothetical protein